MLTLPASRQMFLRYLRRERMQELFLCLRELVTATQCDKQCRFLSVHLADDVIPNSLSRREALEWRMNLGCEQLDDNSCRVVALYKKYFAGTENSSRQDRDCWRRCLEHVEGSQKVEGHEDELQCQMLDDILQHQHHSPLPSFELLEQCIVDFLSNTVFPNYLKSHDHLQYQLQMLKSGLNSLHLADFLYSDEYLMIITEFLDMKGLSDYLGFLLGVINLSGMDRKCSFDDALELYSRYLVIDSVQYIELPVSITNSIINQMCQFKSVAESADPNMLESTIVFECAFRPIYLFLEQFWLPEFLVCRTYQHTVNQLSRRIDSNHVVRQRNHNSENIDRLASPGLASMEDSRVSPALDSASVHSEPTISAWNRGDGASSFQPSNVWWPSPRLENGPLRNIGCRPMSLGSFDDLGRYQPVNEPRRQFPINDTASSSDILSTISELGLGLWTKLSSTSSGQPTTVLSPDEKARQIINDVHIMTLRNQ